MQAETKKHADLMVEYVRTADNWGRHLYDDAVADWRDDGTLEIYESKPESQMPKLLAQYRGEHVICVCTDVYLFADEFWKPK